MYRTPLAGQSKLGLSSTASTSNFLPDSGQENLSGFVISQPGWGIGLHGNETLGQRQEGLNGPGPLVRNLMTED